MDTQSRVLGMSAFLGAPAAAAPVGGGTANVRLCRRRRPQRRRRCVVMRSSSAPASGGAPSATDAPPFDVDRWLRPGLRDMDAYTPILPYEVLAEKLGRRAEDIVKLDANENPYGPSPSVASALHDARFLHIYPDPDSSALRRALAEYTGVDASRLLVGAGADELIDLLFRLCVTPGAGDRVVNFPPTFGMYRFDADVNGAEVVSLPRGGDDHEDGAFALPLRSVEALFDEEKQRRAGGGGGAARRAPPKMVFVTSPNNPDGSRVSDEQLRRLLALPTLVVLDEAYAEFADDDRIGWSARYDNLVVLRTFSKWAALAGLRVGYGAFPPALLRHLWKIKQPYNVNVAAQIAAEVSLRERHDLLAKVARLREERARFYERVRAYPWLKAYASHSNFVLCRVRDDARAGGAAELRRHLAEHKGILIRYYTTPALRDCVRVSMGTREQMDALYSALDELN